MTAATVLTLLRRFWPALPMLALAIALLATRHTLADVKAQRDAAVAFGGQVTAATRVATANPRLTPEQVPAAIDLLARQRDAYQRDLGSALAQIATQNQSIESLRAEGERQQRASA